jgi:hypothetical protein
LPQILQNKILYATDRDLGFDTIYPNAVEHCHNAPNRRKMVGEKFQQVDCRHFALYTSIGIPYSQRYGRESDSSDPVGLHPFHHTSYDTFRSDGRN